MNLLLAVSQKNFANVHEPKDAFTLVQIVGKYVSNVSNDSIALLAKMSKNIICGLSLVFRRLLVDSRCRAMTMTHLRFVSMTFFPPQI